MDSTSLVNLAFAIIIIINSVIVIIAAATTKTCDSSRDRELEVLDNWWPYNHSTTDHCKWNGITCNRAGRVAEINMQGTHAQIWGPQLKELDVLAFPYLTRIHLTACGLFGEIPTEIGNLSKLTYLKLSGNQLIGELPLSLAKLTKLKVLDVSYNYIYGAIPPQIGNLKSLVVLDLSFNNISGSLPSSLGQLMSLESLILNNNEISGSLPSSLGQLTSLVAVELSNNYFNGSLPSSLGKLIRLKSLILNNNYISGSLPSSLGQLTSLGSLILSHNQLEGVFGAGIEKLPSIKTIYLSRNSISEQIPIQLGYVANAQFLSIDLSRNNLFGGVPESLSSLKNIDLSHNDLKGGIPPSVWDKFSGSSFLGNPKLDLPSFNKKASRQNKLKFFLPAAMFFACSIIGGFLVVYYIKRKKRSCQVTSDCKHGDIFKVWNYDGKIAYADIIESTADFDLRHCIGTGGYGSVYRAELPSGRVVAVKKLHRFEGENPTYDMCFRNEAKVLSEIRHRNIVRLFGFCLHKRCMFLPTG